MKIKVEFSDFHSSTGRVLNMDTGEELDLHVTEVSFHALPSKMNELNLKVLGVPAEFVAEHGKFKLDVWLTLQLWWWRLKDKLGWIRKWWDS